MPTRNEAGLASLKLIKHNWEHEQEVKKRQQALQELRPLEEQWLRCLLYLLAPGGGGGEPAGGGGEPEASASGGPAGGVAV